MANNTPKTAWEIARWQRRKAEDQNSKPTKDTQQLVKSYGKLRLIASNQEVKEDICFLNSLAELSHEIIFSKKPVKKPKSKKKSTKILFSTPKQATTTFHHPQ